MLTDTPPYNNNDVRLALKYAIDRKDLLERVLQGYGVLGNDHPIAPANRFLATELPQREYDPDKARFHMKKSGIGQQVFRLSASEAAFSGALDAAALIKEHAARAGIVIEIVREPNDGYWSNVWLKKPWCITYWSGRPSEDWMFSIGYSSTASWNDTHWKNEQFDRLLVEARAELNDDKRRALYVEMQRLVRDEGGAIIPVFASDVMGLSTQLQTPDQVGASFEMDNYRCAERWWFS